MLWNLIFNVKSGCIITSEGQQINNTALPEIFRLLLDKNVQIFYGHTSLRWLNYLSQLQGCTVRPHILREIKTLNKLALSC